MPTTNHQQTLQSNGITHLEGGKRLVFKPANNPVRLTEDENVDWLRVTAICIIFIGDYHD
jgi:toxin HigB-1